MVVTMVLGVWFNHMVNHGFTIVNHMVNHVVEQYPPKPWFNHGIFGRGKKFLFYLPILTYPIRR